EARQADQVWLATDLDREGESIAWHIAEYAGLTDEQVRRVTFNEITKGAIDDAFAHPRSINLDLVNAQQARRVIDRLVGYKLSPLVASKIRRGLSAGRVQSVASRRLRRSPPARCSRRRRASSALARAEQCARRSRCTKASRWLRARLA